MNGDNERRVTKIMDELYCIVARSGCIVGDDPEQAAEQIKCSDPAHSWPCDHPARLGKDSTPPIQSIQSLLPPFTLLSNVRLGHTDFDGFWMVPRLSIGRSHRC